MQKKEQIIMSDTFIVSTDNFIAKKIACKALKAADSSELVHGLYKKACMKGGKIVIDNLNELIAWRDALKAYSPADKTEGKVYRVLIARAARSCEKRTNISDALGREAL